MMQHSSRWQVLHAVLGRAWQAFWLGRPQPALATVRARRGAGIAVWAVVIAAVAGVVCFPSSARAGALDCLSDTLKVLDPSKLEKIGDIAQCSGYLANPTPTFGVALTLVGAAMAAGILPDNAEDCKNAVPIAGAKLVLGAIDALGLPVPGQLKEELKSNVESESQAAYNKVLNEFPVLAALAQMFNCACVIAANGGELFSDFMNVADSCGDLVGDITGIVLELFGGPIESTGCLFTAWFGGCSGSAPGSSDPCYNALCPTGQQCFPPALAAQYPKLSQTRVRVILAPMCGCCCAVAQGVGLAPGKCGCSGGFVGNYEFSYYGADQKVLKSCTCPAPFSAYYITNAYAQSQGSWVGGWKCACPVGKKLIDGKCDLTCQIDQQAKPHNDPSTVLAGQVWSCEACLPGTTSDGKGPCRPLCAPNQHLVTDVLSEIAGSAQDALSKLAGPLGVKVDPSATTKQSCKACAEGTKSDGKGPCIPCAEENSLVAGGVCYTCKPWQKVKLASIQAGGSKCENICPNGVLVDPNAPPSLSFQPGTPQSVKAIAPGAKGKGGAGSNALATPSTSGLPAAPPSSGEVVAGVPPAGGSPSGETLVAKPVLVPMCVPCGANAYAKDNKCHDCGPKAVVNYMLAANIDAGRCTPCQDRQVAKLIGGAMTCAADCSSVGGGGKARPSTNYINDPKDTGRCVPCEPGSKPNDNHTACITSVSLPTGPVTTKGTPALSGKQDRTTKDDGGVVKLNPGPPNTGRQKAKTGATVKRTCPPRMHPNPSGTACVPDLDMPGINDSGSTRPGAPASARGNRGR